MKVEVKANDLRIGNLLEYPNWNNDETKAYFMIKRIAFDGECSLTNGIIELPKTKLEYLKPIPLTAKACCRLGIRITNVQHLNKSSK